MKNIKTFESFDEEFEHYKSAPGGTIVSYDKDQLEYFIRQVYVDGYENGYAKGSWSGKIDAILQELKKYER